MDREKVINELNTDVLPFLQHHCDMQCDREKRWISKMIVTVHDALGLLKEQETMMQCIKGKCRICPHCANCDVDENGLLKEQDTELSYRKAKAITHTATKLDDATCPSCGNVVGEKQIWEGRKIFIQWEYCIFCGQKLDWEGR